MIKTIKIIVIALLISNLTFSQNCTIVDTPDPSYLDINDDGIDGDIENAIFVSISDGNDMSPGTIEQPVQSIERGIELAAAESKDVYVAQGIYSFTEPLILVGGVSLYGQYSGLPDWERSEANTTVINGWRTAIAAHGINIETKIEGFEIHSENGFGEQSSVAISVLNCSENVIIRYNTISSGLGTSGSSGMPGSSGGIGFNGGVGGEGDANGPLFGVGGEGGASSCDNSGGLGGNGGAQGSHNGLMGESSSGSVWGGFGGAYGDPGEDGDDGDNGSDGSNGTDGSASSPEIFINALGEYVTSNGSSGFPGENGIGGGGGGGGGGQDTLFGTDGSGCGGGGGGGGGCGATPGTGGDGGSGSFAFIIIDSKAIIDENSLVTSNGGNGGNGGSGELGGSGGMGRQGGIDYSGQVGSGGNGGNGGVGGNGGSGAGGNGGPSIAIYINETSEVQIGDNQFDIANGGVGGAGGSMSNSGLDGLTDEILGDYMEILIQDPTICINDVIIDEPLSGSVFAEFQIILSHPAMQAISVNYATEDITAFENFDYSPTSGTLNFSTNEIVKSVFVEIFTDDQALGNKTFKLILSEPVNASLEFSESICTITDNGIVAINQNLIANNFSIYPNPASKDLNINSDEFPFSFIIYNSIGQLVLSKTNLAENLKINLEDLPTGLYTIKLNAENKHSTHKFLISR